MTSTPAAPRSLASRLIGSVRPTGDDHRVTQFELFFDLVFVFAFTQVTALMAHEHDAIGVVRGLTILGLLWWAWCSYSWLANQARADRGVLNAGMAVATALIFVMAFAIPDAYGEHAGPRLAAFVVVGAFVLVRLVHIGLYLIAAGDDRGLRRQVLLTMVTALLPAAVALGVGAFLGGEAQTWIWAGAWVYDALVVFLTSRTGGEWRLHSPGHWTERYALVVILAIGESIVSIGVGLREVELDAASLVGSFLAIGGAVILWWIYFHRFAEGVERALERLSPERRVAEASISFTYHHYSVVAGVILTALGIETVMAHIGDGEALGWFGAAALGGGVALYQAATVLVWHRLTGRWLVVRLALATALLPGIALAAVLLPMAALATAVVLGIVLALVESRTRVLRLPDAATE
jgi:low temperature requirement protein LtrA